MPLENPLISIVIPVYNAADYIEATVNNFLLQTYTNLEIILQDDCSKDSTWKVLQSKFKDEQRVKLFQNEKNLGIGPNWNAAYEHASGEYVVIANADDVHFPVFVETAYKNMLQFKVDFVSFKYKILNEKTQSKEFTAANIHLESEIVKDPFETVFFQNPYHIIFTMFKKANIDAIKVDGNAFLNTQICDYELVLRYAKSNTLYYSEEVMGYYRIHDTNNSGKPLAEFRSFYSGVVPYWHKTLVNKFGLRYRKLHAQKLLDFVKGFIKGRESFSLYPIKQCLKYLIK